MKTCTGCGEEKPYEKFSSDRHSRDGFLTKCKVCKNAYLKRHYLENRERRLEWAREYATKNKGKCLQRYKSWVARNPEKRKEIQRKYYLRHAATLNEKARAKDLNNREVKLQRVRNYRARKAQAQGLATADQVRARVEFFGNRCWICGDAWKAIDHVKPLSKGGSNWPANLRPICKSCNSKKATTWKGIKGLKALQDALIRTLRDADAQLFELKLEMQPATDELAVAA